MSQTQIDMMDALLDGTLDDLADIPEYRTYPVGAHKVTISWELNKIIQGVYYRDKDGKDTNNLVKFISMNMEALETIELPSGSDELPLSKGAKANVLFDLTEERGQGRFKVIMGGLREIFGAKSNRELIVESEKAEIVVIISQRQNKDKTKTYIDVDAVMAP